MLEEILIDPESVIRIDFKTRKGEITMHNNSVSGKAFKIKTTKPNDYAVRPNIGIIHPLHKVQIEVSALESTRESSDHKFLVEIYNFDWRKSMSEFKKSLKETRAQLIAKKLLGIKFVEGGKGVKASALTPKRMKDYLEIACVAFLVVQFVLLCVKMIR